MDIPDGVVVIEGFGELFVVIQLLGAGIVLAVIVLADWKLLFGRTAGSRAFHCRQAGRDVEVEFLERRILGLPRTLEVRRCSAFESPEAVACARPCLTAAYRTKADFAWAGPRRPGPLR